MMANGDFEPESSTGRQRLTDPDVAGLNVTDEKGRIPLHRAAERGRSETVLALLGTRRT